MENIVTSAGKAVIVDLANILNYDLRDTINEAIKKTWIGKADRDDNCADLDKGVDVIFVGSIDNSRVKDLLLTQKNIIQIMSNRHYFIALCNNDSDSTVIDYAIDQANKGKEVAVVTGDLKICEILRHSVYSNRIKVVVPIHKFIKVIQPGYIYINVLNSAEGMIQRRLRISREDVISTRSQELQPDIVTAIRKRCPCNYWDLMKELKQYGYKERDIKITLFKLALKRELFIDNQGDDIQIEEITQNQLIRN